MNLVAWTLRFMVKALFLNCLFKLQLGALIPRTAGLSVCQSCKNYKQIAKLNKILQIIEIRSSPPLQWASTQPLLAPEAPPLKTPLVLPVLYAFLPV